MYRRILVAVDGSDTSNKALVAALQLARDRDAQVLLLHCVDELLLLAAGGLGVGSAPERGSRVLEDAEAIAKAAGVRVDKRLVDMPAQRLGETVAEHARDWKADLVVIGSHGRRGLGRLLLGSGAEQILRLAPVPVLCVRREASL
ncbi:universal stress protein [Ramlibacter sp. Leaf400]|uniref:universal stress protein n=1 Tax=Ramlibacter sp. Leaf400 TaxID=1736365 RepID=UPI0006FF7599|nr:universal stress protein [Ramlibacter sp. Leaf400]KQT10876.1 universal stress protein UspA [Ramlibacter sp. Leaf400]